MKSIEEFSLNLLEKAILVADSSEKPNFAISPLSEAISIAILGNAMDDDTQSKVAKTFSIDNRNIDAMNTMFNKLIVDLTNLDKRSTLILANSVWADPVYEFPNSWIDEMESQYNATTNILDLSLSSSHEAIASWVKEATNGHIAFTPSTSDSENPSASIMALNAIYFDGQWTQAFLKEKTENALFRNFDSSESTVAMMSTERNMSYRDEETYQAVGLPFGNKSFSLYLFLPKKGLSTSTLATSLRGGEWNKFVETKINLKLPRFRVAENVDMTATLEKCGIQQIFTETSYVPYSASDNKLTLQYGFSQKNMIVIDEDGAVASAASTSTLGSIMSDLPTTVEFNRPFLFILSERSSGAILMAGRVAKL